MNVKRFVWAAVALFIFVFLYEWLVQGVLLRPLYQEIAHVWRDFATIEADMPFAMLFQFAMSLWLAFVFFQIFPEGGIANGLRYGLYFGVFAGILTASWYLWIPVPAKFAWIWLLTSIIEGLGGGLVLGSVYKK